MVASSTGNRWPHRRIGRCLLFKTSPILKKRNQSRIANLESISGSRVSFFSFWNDLYLLS